LLDPDLSPSAVAKRPRISESYIRKLFDGDTTSFSEFGETATSTRHELLADPKWPGRNIASIAFAWQRQSRYQGIRL
jgi:hypothetical protein